MFGGVRQIARARARMGRFRRKKGRRGNGVSRETHQRACFGRARVSSTKTKIEWPTSVPKVGAHDKQKRSKQQRRRTTRSVGGLEAAAEPQVPLTHSGPSAAGRADEYCRSLAPTPDNHL